MGGRGAPDRGRTGGTISLARCRAITLARELAIPSGVRVTRVGGTIEDKALTSPTPALQRLLHVRSGAVLVVRSTQLRFGYARGASGHAGTTGAAGRDCAGGHDGSQALPGRPGGPGAAGRPGCRVDGGAVLIDHGGAATFVGVEFGDDIAGAGAGVPAASVAGAGVGETAGRCWPPGGRRRGAGGCGGTAGAGGDAHGGALYHPGTLHVASSTLQQDLAQAGPGGYGGGSSGAIGGSDGAGGHKGSGGDGRGTLEPGGAGGGGGAPTDLGERRGNRGGGAAGLAGASGGTGGRAVVRSAARSSTWARSRSDTSPTSATSCVRRSGRRRRPADAEPRDGRGTGGGRRPQSRAWPAADRGPSAADGTHPRRRGPVAVVVTAAPATAPTSAPAS